MGSISSRRCFGSVNTVYSVKVVVSYVYKGMEGYGSYECNHIYGRVENMVGAVGICSTNTYRNAGHWKAPRPKSRRYSASLDIFIFIAQTYNIIQNFIIIYNMRTYVSTKKNILA